MTEPSDNGPTLEEFLESGGNPENYPPIGFASKSTPETISAACAARNRELVRAHPFAIDDEAESERLRLANEAERLQREQEEAAATQSP